MWKKLLESFEPLQHEDPHFGMVEFQENDQDKSFYLMKDVTIGQPELTLSLTVETKDKKSTAAQFTLYKMIAANFTDVIKAAFEFLHTHSGNSSVAELKEQFEIDSIYIDQDKAGNRWELTLAPTNETEAYCVIDFDGLKPVQLTREE